MGKTSHTKGLRAAFFMLAIILGFALLSAQPQELYDQFYRRAHGMSTEEVINLGDRLAGQGHGDSAVAAYTVAINRFDRRLPQNEKIASIQAHQRAAEYWLSRGANLNALQVLMGARDISEAVGTDSLTIGILNNMAYVYLTFKNYEKAAAIFEEAYSLQSKRKDDDAEFKLLNNLASVHIMLDDTAKAKEELQRLKALHPSTKEVQQVASYHIMLLEGALLNHSGRYNEGAKV